MYVSSRLARRTSRSSTDSGSEADPVEHVGFAVPHPQITDI
jgi:hypothetical protein